MNFDKQEKKIITELIKNPRISDNKLGKKTGIPVMTVNRKRKKLEQENKLFYYASVNDLKTDSIRQLYLIKLKSGITREKYLEAIRQDKKFKEFNARYHHQSFIGEKDGHLTSVLILEAKNEAELTEVFNGEIITNLRSRLSEDCISEIITCKIIMPIRIHHNYVPYLNMKNGIIDENWLDDWVYVSE